MTSPRYWFKERIVPNHSVSTVSELLTFHALENYRVRWNKALLGLAATATGCGFIAWSIVTLATLSHA